MNETNLKINIANVSFQKRLVSASLRNKGKKSINEVSSLNEN